MALERGTILPLALVHCRPMDQGQKGKNKRIRIEMVPIGRRRYGCFPFIRLIVARPGARARQCRWWVPRARRGAARARAGRRGRCMTAQGAMTLRAHSARLFRRLPRQSRQYLVSIPKSRTRCRPIISSHVESCGRHSYIIQILDASVVDQQCAFINV